MKHLNIFNFLFISIYLQNISSNQFFNPSQVQASSEPNIQNKKITPSHALPFDPSKTLEINTHVHGDIDPDDKINITTQIIDHINKETYYITPKFSHIDGKFKYRHSLQQNNSNDEYRLSGDVSSQIKGDANLGVHIQQYDQNNKISEKSIFKKYSNYLKKYIQYIYNKSAPVDPKYLQDLNNQYVLYGTQANGKDPIVNSMFESILDKHQNTNSKKFDSLGGAKNRQTNGFSYAVTNLNANNDTNSFQNLISNATGGDPVTGVELKTSQHSEYVRGYIKGEAIAKEARGVNETLIDAQGVNEQFGFSDNVVLADERHGRLTSIGEINNLAVNDEYHDDEMINEKKDYFDHKPKSDYEKKKYFADKKFIENWQEDGRGGPEDDAYQVGIRVPDIARLKYFNTHGEHKSNQNYVHDLVQNNHKQHKHQKNILLDNARLSPCDQSNHSYHCL